MAFLFKKLVSGLLTPVSLAVELLVAGLLAWTLARRPRLGRGLIAAGTGVILVFGYPWVPGLMLAPLEARYPPYLPPAEPGGPPAAVVVLGRGFHPPTAGCPLTSQVDAVLMTRLMEAVRVCRLLPESRIVVSLAGKAPAADKERFLEQFAAVVGLAPDRFEAVSDARDTGEEVRAFCSRAPGRQLVLVTSAAHMPRAMGLFRRYGVEPVAAPCGHRVQPPVEAEDFSASALFPSPSALRDADEALHEYLGMAWDWVGAR